MVLLVDVPGASLLAFDGERSTLSALADDRGTDLRGATDERRLLPPLGADFLAEGGTTALIVVHGQQVPGAGASSIRAAGTLVFSSGGTPELVRLPLPRLTAGTVLTVGPVRYTITAWQPSEWQEGGHDLVLSTEDDEQRITGFRFLAADGSPLDCQQFRSAGKPRPGHPAERTFAFAGKPAGFGVEVTWRRDATTVSVPFDLTTRLDLQPAASP